MRKAITASLAGVLGVALALVIAGPFSLVNAAGVLHVGDIDAQKVFFGQRWGVFFTVTVHDGDENPVEGASIQGNHTGDFPKSFDACCTNEDGQMTFWTGFNLESDEITFTVDGVSADGFTYDASLNHDPDGDSDGTTMTVTR